MFQSGKRLIKGPSETIPASYFLKEKFGDVNIKGLVDSNGRRADSRSWDEIRPLFLRTGIVDNAKGSSYYESDGAKVICSVYGPREAKRKTEFSSKGKIICEVSFAPFCQQIRRSSSFHQESKSKTISNFVETALGCAVCLDSFPKSQLDIYMKVLQDSGDVLTAAITSASVAIADAGIEMYDLVTACSVAFDDKNFVLDPSDEELQPVSTNGCLRIAYLPSLNQLSCMVQTGSMINSERNTAGLKVCIEGCLRMHTLMQDCLVHGLEKKKKHLHFQQKYT
eukprot:gene7978-8835_t